MNDDKAGAAGGGRLGRVFLLGFVVLVGAPLAARLYVELRWFRSMGHAELFLTPLATKLALVTATGLCAGLLALVNVRLATRFSRGLAPLYLYDPEGTPRINLSEVAARLAAPLCIAIAVLTGLYYDRYWSVWLQFVHASDFSVRDPLFDRDVGFYVFDLPLYETACGFALWVLGTSIVLSAVLYALRGALATSELRTQLDARARAHLSVLLCLLLVALALRAYLDMFDVLRSSLGPMTGASYADVNAKLPALRVKIGVAAVAALLLLVNARREDFSLAIAAAVLYVGAYAGVELYPAVVHRFSVLPNELERETPYLKYNIEATRAAYGLDAVAERELTARGTLTAADIARNRETIDNVRLWDHKPLLDTFAQIQEIRTYYDFASVDNDRYMIGGQLRQVMLSARELNSESDSLPNPTWINKRLTFTHGYGLTLGLVNETTPEGLPVLLVQDIPPVSHTPEIRVTQPAIYFGELSSDHVFVRTRNRELHYPAGQSYVETDYDGKAGIRFDSVLTRVLLALELGSIELLLSDDIDNDSRALLHRNIKEMVGRVAPFLMLDADPYLVVRDNGSLVWIYDAYTTTDRYPYSEPNRKHGLNYIRNSVKAVIDAYDGTVTLFAIDESDPVLRTWRKIFPHSFTSMREMPRDIRAHLRYPERIFDVQSEMFATYHMREPELLYNREDLWEVPTIGKERMEPYYTVMKLPGEARAEFILMLPFTPKRKDNLAAWMVARSDGSQLGELVVYRFPKDRLVFGPQQVVTRINQDADIARQISLWNQRGSAAEFGTLLVIPVEESLLYVRPLYLRSEGSKIPELKRVIAAYEKRIAMRPSLREAVDAIFGEQQQPIATASGMPPSVPEPNASAGAPAAEPSALADTPLASQALTRFKRAIEAQRSGDWAGYGKELDAVEQLLQQMAAPAGDPSGVNRTPGAAPQGAPAAPPAKQRPEPR